MSESRIAELEERMDRVERLLAGVEENNTLTREMHEVFKAVRGGFKVLEWMGTIAKTLAIILGVIAAGFVFLKTGVWGRP